MDPQLTDPLGLALEAYYHGEDDAELTIRRDDGHEVDLPVSHFFRVEKEFTEIEETAIDLCLGEVLDVGAGAGIHTLCLQEQGFDVTAIDNSQEAVEVLTKRGAENAHWADFYEFDEGPFDTILVLGNGLGMAGTLANLDRFLDRLDDLLSAKGQVLIDSLDVRVTDDPAHLAYHEANRKAGRYVGEIRVELEFEGTGHSALVAE